MNSLPQLQPQPLAIAIPSVLSLQREGQDGHELIIDSQLQQSEEASRIGSVQANASELVADVWERFQGLSKGIGFGSLEIRANVDAGLAAQALCSKWKKISTVPVEGSAATALAGVQELKKFWLQSNGKVSDVFVQTVLCPLVPTIKDYFQIQANTLSLEQWTLIINHKKPQARWKQCKMDQLPSTEIQELLKQSGVEIKVRPENFLKAPLARFVRTVQKDT